LLPRFSSLLWPRPRTPLFQRKQHGSIEVGFAFPSCSTTASLCNLLACILLSAGKEKERKKKDTSFSFP
jgi:hypothetical protein